MMNGIFAKRFKTFCRGMTEELFARTLPIIYDIVHPFKEELRYATVLNMVNTIADINDVLVKKGYALNVYERKNNTFFVDIIKTRMQKK